MFCTNCGKEIKDDLKFCPECGKEIGATKSDTPKINNKIIIFSVLAGVIIIAVIFAMVLNNKKTETNFTEEQTNTQVEEVSQGQDSKNNILSEINKYQAKYFEIIKRHDALLQVMSNDDADRDLDELDNLFAEIKTKIGSNYYLDEYNKIETDFENNAGETTLEIDEYTKQHYDAVDKLLNDVYKEVKTKISESDFEQLKSSQIQWLKDVDAYKTVFEQQGLGSVGNFVYNNYQINMRNFRTLLLMLYL